MTVRPTRFPTLLAAALAAAVLQAPTAAHAQDFQWPDEPENLEVLPDDIGSDGLRDVMRGFTSALGVRCSHCHEGEGDDLSEYDFASDEKQEKRVARVMMRMVEAINDEHLSEVEDEVHTHADGHEHVHSTDHVQVQCVTCHRGAEKPRLIEDVIGEVVREEGVEAGIRRYRELRERYFGGFTYDFRPGPLAELGRDLASDGRVEDGIRVVQLEAEYHPESYTTRFVLARLQQTAGRTDEAVASMEEALELAPDGAKDFLRRQLDRMRDG